MEYCCLFCNDIFIFIKNLMTVVNKMFFFFPFAAFLYLHSELMAIKLFSKFLVLRSYKKGCFFLLFYVFFDVESESEVRFGRSPLVFEL